MNAEPIAVHPFVAIVIGTKVKSFGSFVDFVLASNDHDTLLLMDSFAELRPPQFYAVGRTLTELKEALHVVLLQPESQRKNWKFCTLSAADAHEIFEFEQDYRLGLEAKAAHEAPPEEAAVNNVRSIRTKNGS